MIGPAASVDGEYRKTILPNGIRLVTEWIPHVRSVAVGVWVDTGSRHEPADRGGISHFIEHLVFKGTESRSAEDIARAVDSVGGQMDAFTTKEHTCFYVTVLDEHLPLAADLLADILLHPRFDAGDIEREKSVVLQEFGMVEDTPDDVIHDLFAERVWPQHPLGRPILGDRKIVQGFERDTLLDYFRTEYCPERITIAAAGHVRHEQLVDLLGKPVPRLPPVPDAADGRAARPGDQPRPDRAPARAGPLRAGGPRARAGRSRALRAVPPEHDLRGEHVLAPVPGGAGARGTGLLDPLGQRGLPGRRALLRVRGHGARALPAGGGADAPGVPVAARRRRHAPTSSGGRRTTSRGA